MSDDGGNGKPEVEKTPEQLQEERLKRYQEKPGNFIEVSEIICAALRSRKSVSGVGVLIGESSRIEIDVAQSEIVHRLEQARVRMDIEAQMKQQAAQDLINPGSHGIMDFMRRRRR